MINRLLAMAVLALSAASFQGAAQSKPEYGGLPEGKGRIETFAFCSSCHSLMIVKQQKLSREDWEETLEWMVDEQEMPELPETIKPLVLDYLAKHFGQEKGDK